MPDDVSTGELNRRLDAHEQRTDRIHGEQDSRITNLAKDTVPLALYQRGERDRDRQMQRLDEEHTEDVRQLRQDHVDDVKALRAEIKEARDRPQMTLLRWTGVLVGVVTVVIALCALAVQAYGTLKGAR